ncbi:M48 family peptidase, partial [Campylobacter coli]|nr:M48 family peptidase [Campylobacter coli]EHA5136588.1 M48 family metallopeptidase [Campylobacter jejuni]
NKAYVNLNLKLIQKSLKAIEYVILHEICHLKFPNHSKEFYDFIEYFMSDFRQREKEFLS